jgi:TolA-binding protein
MPRFSIRRRDAGLVRIALIVTVASYAGLAECEGRAAPAQPSADGSAVRYQREPGSVRASSPLETKATQAKKRAAAERKRTASHARPVGQREAIADKVAGAQIEVLERLIRDTDPAHAEYPDLLFRLAELHLSRKAYFEQSAGALDAVIHAHAEAKRAQDAKRERAAQRHHRQSARTAGEAAVRVYRLLVDTPRHATYKRLDAALYYYALELGELGRESEMQKTFARLVQEFPTSPFVPNVYLAFGDLKFSQGEIADALRLYTSIVDGYPDSPVYAYALYKIAWCHLNPLGTADPRYDVSLDHFVATVRATLKGKAGSEENGRFLRRDARRDLVRAYVHAGKPSQAWKFFSGIGEGPTPAESMAREMMVRLAEAYFGEGKYVESSAVYHDLQARFSDDPNVCAWQARVVINALATDDKAIQWKEAKRLTERWRVFATRDGIAKQDRVRCKNDTRATLVQLATTWHDEADKTGRQETYDHAQEAYAAFLDLFAEEKSSYEMAYYHAELLWQQATRLTDAARSSQDRERAKQRFAEAHTAFVHVLERAPKGRFAKDAAYAQMLAMKNALDYDETATSRRGCALASDGRCLETTRGDAAGRHERIPYSTENAAMLAAYDRYAKFITDGKDQELPKILYHRAKLMVEHNAFDDARPVLEKLVVRFDGTIYAAWGAEMLLDVLAIAWGDEKHTQPQRDRAAADLERWARRLEGLKLWKHREADRVRSQVPLLVSAVVWRRAEDARERGEFELCAKHYLDIHNAFDDHDRADELLFNAARCLDAAYMVGSAIRARETLIEHHPSSKLAKQTLRELAENYQAIAFYDKAADRFERYASAHAKDDYAAQALQNAYLFRLGLGDGDQARKNLEHYEKMFRRKDPARAAEIFWSKHAILDEDEARLDHAREYIATYGTKGGVDRLVVAHAVAGQIAWRRSCGRELLHDTCVTMKRRRATAGDDTRRRAQELRRRMSGIPNRCGSDERAVITIHPRDPKLAEAAQQHFEQIVKLARQDVGVPSDDTARLEAFRNAFGMALVYRADRKYEDYLSLEMPTELDFGTEHMWKKGTGVPRLEREYEAAMKRRADTVARFEGFHRRKMALAHELLEAYGDVKRSSSPHWMLAAAARNAMVAQNYADQLYRAPVPAAIKTQEMYEDYCDELGLKAEEPEKLATESFRYCLERSTAFRYWNEFSRLCEEEMQQRDPDKYPATNEIFGQPRYTDIRLDHVGVKTDLSG